MHYLCKNSNMGLKFMIPEMDLLHFIHHIECRPHALFLRKAVTCKMKRPCSKEL